MNGKIFAVTNKKGGVGKTTTCEQLVDIASNQKYGFGLKVLGISIDPQGNWDNSLGIENGTSGIYDFIVNDMDSRIQISDTLDFITCSGATAIKVGLEQSKEPFAELRFSRNLSLIAGDYDLIVIDCPPDENYLNNCVYAAADGLIVPVTTDRFSLEGILELADCVKYVQPLNPNLHMEGILITKVKRNTLVEKEAEQDAAQCAVHLKTKVFKNTISLSTIVEKAQREYKPLMQYAPSAKITKEYRAFVIELLEGRESVCRGSFSAKAD